MAENSALLHTMTRRRLLGAAGTAALTLTKPAWAETMIDLPLPGGPGARQITTAFPQKGADDPAADPSTAAGDAV